MCALLIAGIVLAAPTARAESGSAGNGPAAAPPTVNPLTGMAPGALQPFARGLNLPLNPKVMIIPVNDDETSRSGMIDHWQAAFIERRLQRAASEKFDLVVLEIFTNGGDLDACDRINSAIAKCTVPVIAHSEKAISGGALISLGTRMIVMKPGPAAQIGDAMAVSPFANLTPDQRLKMDAAMRAKMKTLCERNSYPSAIAQGMVASDVEVHEVDPKFLPPQTERFVTGEELKDLEGKLGSKPATVKTWKSKGQLLSLSPKEAWDVGLASGLAVDEEDLFLGLGIKPSLIDRADITPAEKAARFLASPIWSVLLVLVGLVALVWEMKSPGHGVGYLTFAFCIGVFFWLQIFANTAGLLEILLFGAGAILIAVEIFIIPGTGVAGFAGFGMVLVSVILAFLPENALPSLWRGPRSQAESWQHEIAMQGLMWATLTVFLILTSVVLVLVKGAKLPMLNRLALNAQVPAPTQPAAAIAGAAGVVVASESAVAAIDLLLVGQIGDAETVLRPSGKVRLAGITYDGLSEGGFISAGAKVVVLRQMGKSLVVREVE